MSFTARPMPEYNSLQAGLPPRQQPPLTQPKSPQLVTRHRARSRSTTAHLPR